jgi:hypothetical protein
MRLTLVENMFNILSKYDEGKLLGCFNKTFFLSKLRMGQII